jgi:hypothetical protein
MAAVRAKTMQTITSKKIFSEGQPFAATIRAPRANGRAKTVCEKRISRKKRATGPLANALIDVAQSFYFRAAQAASLYLPHLPGNTFSE